MTIGAAPLPRGTVITRGPGVNAPIAFTFLFFSFPSPLLTTTGHASAARRLDRRLPAKRRWRAASYCRLPKPDGGRRQPPCTVPTYCGRAGHQVRRYVPAHALTRAHRPGHCWFYIPRTGISRAPGVRYTEADRGRGTSSSGSGG
jgi:hypothetical protein